MCAKVLALPFSASIGQQRYQASTNRSTPPKALRGVQARVAGWGRIPVKQAGPFRRADWLEADHGAEHVRRACQVPENPRGMIHPRSWLQGHGFGGNVGHEALCVAEIEGPRVKQRVGHAGVPWWGLGLC
jgi:hypothetical protein